MSVHKPGHYISHCTTTDTDSFDADDITHVLIPLDEANVTRLFLARSLLTTMNENNPQLGCETLSILSPAVFGTLTESRGDQRYHWAMYHGCFMPAKLVDKRGRRFRKSDTAVDRIDISEDSVRWHACDAYSGTHFYYLVDWYRVEQIAADYPVRFALTDTIRALAKQAIADNKEVDATKDFGIFPILADACEECGDAPPWFLAALRRCEGYLLGSYMLHSLAADPTAALKRKRTSRVKTETTS